MRPCSQTQNDIGWSPLVRVIGVDNRPIGNASSKFHLILSSEAQSTANQRVQTVGADQEIGVIVVQGLATCQSN